MSSAFSRSLVVPSRGASRRSFVVLSALAGLGLPVLAGCDLPGVSKDKGGSASPSGSTASAGGSASASAPAQAGSTEWQKLDGHVMGHKVSVEVSPVVRQDDKSSYIAVKLTRASDDASIDAVKASSYKDDSGNKLSISNYLGAGPFRAGTGASLVKLLDTGSGRVWSAVDGSGLFLELAPGEDMTSYLSFGKVDTDTVTVMVPMAGFTTVSVLDANDAKKAKIDLSIAQAALKQSSHDVPELADPVAIERYTRALDDSTSTHAGGKDITVTLASDVTFASDSADLAPGAEAQLQIVATQLGQHPDGGTLTIVGHTDMQRMQEVAHQIISGIKHLHAGNPTISIGVFDPSIYIDRVLMRRVQQDGGNSALQCYGTALLARYKEQNDADKHLYLHTASARALLDACDAGGVRLADAAERELITERGSRYGNAYAWMSREVIKMAADQTGRLVADDKHHAELQPTGEPAADVLIALLNQIATRGADRTSDLPMPTEAVRLREGGCKDVEAYFAQAYMMSSRSVMSETAIAGKRFISKTHGAHTFLAADAVRYCSVEFPPGTVWGRFGDGYAPLRLTGFCFDRGTAATVFGAEYMANVLEVNQRAVHNYFRHIVQS